MRSDLTRRERQILEILYELGEGTAKQIRAAMPGDLADATVRTLLRILEEKRAVSHRLDGKRFVFRPSGSRDVAASSAFRRVLDVFFGGSVEKALSLHLADPKTVLDASEVQRLRELINTKSKRGNKNGRSYGKMDRVD